jgi:Tfp pilus assembly protein PilN
MSKINLLPDSCMAAEAAGQRHRRYVVWGVLALAVAAVWWQAATLQGRRLSQLVELESRRLHEEQAQAQVLASMEKRHRQSEAALALESELSEPIQTTAMVAALSRVLPPAIALTRLSVEMTPIRAAAEPAVPKSGPRRSALAKPAEEKPIRIELEGIAMTEGDVARCVSALTGHRLFTNVKLAKSRQVLDDGPPRFGFLITVDVPVNRKYIVGKEATAHAS